MDNLAILNVAALRDLINTDATARRALLEGIERPAEPSPQAARLAALADRMGIPKRRPKTLTEKLAHEGTVRFRAGRRAFTRVQMLKRGGKRPILRQGCQEIRTDGMLDGVSGNHVVAYLLNGEVLPWFQISKILSYDPDPWTRQRRGYVKGGKEAPLEHAQLLAFFRNAMNWSHGDMAQFLGVANRKISYRLEADSVHRRPIPDWVWGKVQAELLRQSEAGDVSSGELEARIRREVWGEADAVRAETQQDIVVRGRLRKGLDVEGRPKRAQTPAERAYILWDWGRIHGYADPPPPRPVTIRHESADEGTGNRKAWMDWTVPLSDPERFGSPFDPRKPHDDPLASDGRDPPEGGISQAPVVARLVAREGSRPANPSKSADIVPMVAEGGSAAMVVPFTIPEGDGAQHWIERAHAGYRVTNPDPVEVAEREAAEAGDELPPVEPDDPELAGLPRQGEGQQWMAAMKAADPLPAAMQEIVALMRADGKEELSIDELVEAIGPTDAAPILVKSRVSSAMRRLGWTRRIGRDLDRDGSPMWWFVPPAD